MNLIKQRPGLASACLLILTLVLLLNGLGDYDLRNTTEPRVAGIAAEMFVSHDYLLPRLNGHAFLEKPPLYPWLASVSYRLFGVSPFSARLPSVIAASVLILFLFWSLKQATQNSRLAFSAAILLLCTAGFLGHSRQAGQDVLLTLGVAVAVLGFYVANMKDDRQRYWFLLALGLATASLAKGVLGLAITGVTVFSYLICETVLFERRFLLKKWVYPALAALLGLVPIGIWLVALNQAHGWDAVFEVIWTNSFGRFMGGLATVNAHEEPFYYYLTYLPEIFQPWTLLVYLGLWHHLKQAPRDRFSLFLCCWLVVPFILLSMSSGKRPAYLLSLYPAAAIIATTYGFALCEQIKQGKALSRSKAIACLYALLLTLGSVFLLYTLGKMQHGLLPIVVTGLILLPLIVLMWRSWRSGHLPATARYIVGLVMVALLCYGGWIQPYEKHEQALKPLFDEVTGREREDYRFVLFQPDERIQGATVFYTGHTLPEVYDEMALIDYLSQSNSHLALLRELSEEVKNHSQLVAKIKSGKRDYFIISH